MTSIKHSRIRTLPLVLGLTLLIIFELTPATNVYIAVGKGNINQDLFLENNSPIALDDIYSTQANTPLTIPAPGVLLNDSDPDGDPLSALLNTSPQYGDLNLNPDGSFLYSPNPGFFGSDIFTYQASDGFVYGDGTVGGHQKISSTEGGFTGALMDGDCFGAYASNLGDLDGDGVTDLAIGAHLTDDGGVARGAVWIIFLNSDGTVKHQQKISSTEGNFSGVLHDYDRFGRSVTRIGDLDGDSVTDIAVGAPLDDEGETNTSSEWILFLNTDGTVKGYYKISATEPAFNGTLQSGTKFGVSAIDLGDMDGDGVHDLAVGAPLDDDGGEERGAVWILFLNTDGTVKDFQKISDTQGGFTGILHNYDVLGGSLANLGDLDGDGVTDIAVGSNLDNDGGPDRGAIWIMFLNADGTVKSSQKISDTVGNFTGILNDGYNFGMSSANIGDLDKDGVTDIGVGAPYDGDGGTQRGALWILFLNTNGTVKSSQKISDLQGNFTGILDNLDRFGRAVASLGDLNGDSVLDFVVGASQDGDGGPRRGAIWVLFSKAVSLGNIANVNIDVTSTNQRPVASDQSVVTNPDMPLPITLSGSDPEGSPLNYTVVTTPANGYLSGTPPDLIFSPEPGFIGSDSFTFKVNDGVLDSALATITINVITPDLIRNGSFETDLSFWTLNLFPPASATFSLDPTTAGVGVSSARVDVTVPGTSLRSVQLNQSSLSLVQGRNYRLVFWAKASVTRNIRIILRNTDNPNTIYSSTTLRITTSWTRYELILPVNATDANGNLEFGLGWFTSIVWLDGIELLPISP